jgi:hypothetical protein
MKNILWTLAYVALASSALAVNLGDKKTLTFSTTGVDKYTDGTTVLDNEQYALVYVAPTKTFGGFYTDGSLVNTDDNQLLCKLAVAKDGKCPEQRVQFNWSLIKKGAGGSFVVVVLDTRSPDTSTTGKLGDLIMGWGVAGQTAGISSSSIEIKSISSDQAVSPGNAPQLPPDVVAPVITGIEVKNDKVIVSMENVSPKAYYGLNATDDVKKNKGQWLKTEFAKRKKGDASGKMELEYPVSEGAKFFQVVAPATAN